MLEATAGQYLIVNDEYPEQTFSDCVQMGYEIGKSGYEEEHSLSIASLLLPTTVIKPTESPQSNNRRLILPIR